MTAEGVLTLIASAMSLVFGYLPYLKDEYDALDSRYKPLIQLGLIAVIVFGYLAINCKFDWPCIQLGLSEAGKLFIACLVANQVTYMTCVRQQKQVERDAAEVEPANELQ